MNFRRFIVMYRIPVAIALMALGFLIGFKLTWWVAWIPMLVSILMVVAYFMLGPMTLIQGYMESGDIEGAQKLLKQVKFPNLLYKPIRSTYFMIQANFSTMSEDLDTAEIQLKKSLETGMAEKEFEGSTYMQLGFIAYKKGNTKEAYEHLRKAVNLGLPDADSKANAFLALCNICVQRRDFRNAKVYFSKAKNAKPTNEQLVAQIKDTAKYMARIPG